MQYLIAIKQNFNQILAQIQGKIVSERNSDGTLISVCYPNVPMQTATGKQFNVMGLVELGYADGSHVTYLLAAEFNMDVSMIDTDQFAKLFVISPQGRDYSRKFEPVILSLLHDFVPKAKPIIGGIPGYWMFLSEEQRQY